MSVRDDGGEEGNWEDQICWFNALKQFYFGECSGQTSDYRVEKRDVMVKLYMYNCRVGLSC